MMKMLSTNYKRNTWSLQQRNSTIEMMSDTQSKLLIWSDISEWDTTVVIQKENLDKIWSMFCWWGKNTNNGIYVTRVDVSMLLTTVLLMYIYTACWLNNYVVQLCPFWCNSYGARLSRLLTVEHKLTRSGNREMVKNAIGIFVKFIRGHWGDTGI